MKPQLELTPEQKQGLRQIRGQILVGLGFLAVDAGLIFGEVIDVASLPSTLLAIAGAGSIVAGTVTLRESNRILAEQSDAMNP